VRAMLVPHRDQIEIVELDVQQNPDHRVDVALFDTYGQPGLGVPRVKSLAQSGHVVTVAVYTWSLNAASRAAAYRAGARGIIAKGLTAADLVVALRRVARGEVVEAGAFRGAAQGPWPGTHWGLSARESEALVLLSTGMPNRAIAEALFISENTVRTHLKAVFRKLAVSNRSQAVARALADPSFTARRGDLDNVVSEAIPAQ
jgi:DNA-binding NarL/FixJ family response regulator